MYDTTDVAYVEGGVRYSRREVQQTIWEKDGKERQYGTRPKYKFALLYTKQ